MRYTKHRQEEIDMIFGKTGKLTMMAIAVIFVILFSACSGRSRQVITKGGDIFERMQNTTYEVKFLFPGWDTQPDMNLVIRAFNDKLTELGYPGLSIKLEGMDWGSWAGRATAIVLSGGDYDLAYAPNWAAFYKDAMLGGAWLPWDTYIDLIPEFAKLLEPWREYLYVWGANPREKHIYRIPGIKEYASYLTEIRWNKTVADKLGITEAMRNIKSVYELEPYLEMYKNAYGNNGMAVLAVDTDSLLNYFMPTAGNGVFQSVYDFNTDSYLNGAFTPWFDDYIALRRDWYAKGYIPDYQQTELWDDLVRKFGPESFLVWFSVGKPGGEAEYNQNAMQLLGFEWGATNITPAFVDFNSLMGVAWGLNARSKNPEAAAFVYALLSTNKELTNLINFGIEGVHYTLDSSSILIKNEPSRYYPNLMWMLGNRFLCHRLPGEPENLGKLYEEFNNSAVRFPNFAFAWPSDEMWRGVDVDMFWGTFNALGAQYQRSIQIGTISDSDIADIRRKLRQANYQGMDAVLNREYAAFKAAAQK
jgi:putative aldouronate transport system substrate-binding protein